MLVAQAPGVVRVDQRGRAAIAETRRLLAANSPAPVADAAFEFDGLRTRVDLLEPGRLVAIRSGTRLKQRYLQDLAVQAWVVENAGYILSEIMLACVDSDFVYSGEGDYSGLLRRHDVTERVRKLQQRVPEWLAQLRETLAGEEPDVHPDSRCWRPTPCPFHAHCVHPAHGYPISALRASPRLVEALLAEGYDDLREVPANRLQKPQHRRVRQAVISGTAELSEELITFARELPYPRYYLDFEAVQFAVPVWPGTRPYQSLPFQWSVHVERSCEEVPESHGFLDLTGASPLRGCAENLLACLGDSGPVVVYGDFERRMINQLGAWFPDLKPAFVRLRERVVDLLPLVQQHYYHRDMQGAWSLKAVVATLPNAALSGVAGPIQDGLAAQRAYLEIIAADTGEARRRELAAALREYCRADTMALLRLVREFAGSSATQTGAR